LFSPENGLLAILVFMSDRSIGMTFVLTSVSGFLATRAGMKLTREKRKKLIEKKEKNFREERPASRVKVLAVSPMISLIYSLAC
jgi:hypothetical protein